MIIFQLFCIYLIEVAKTLVQFHVRELQLYLSHKMTKATEALIKSDECCRWQHIVLLNLLHLRIRQESNVLTAFDVASLIQSKLVRRDRVVCVVFSSTRVPMAWNALWIIRPASLNRALRSPTVDPVRSSFRNCSLNRHIILIVFIVVTTSVTMDDAIYRIKLPQMTTSSEVYRRTRPTVKVDEIFLK